MAALLDDLAERGLLDNTLVVMMGEFGRTPKINGNAGRDHHGRANSVLRLRRGHSRRPGPGPDRRQRRRCPPSARSPRPTWPAVLYHKLGIDPDTKFEAPDGRPIRLVDCANPPRELL